MTTSYAPAPSSTHVLPEVTPEQPSTGPSSPQSGPSGAAPGQPSRLVRAVQHTLAWLAVSGPTSPVHTHLVAPQGSPLWVEGVHPAR